jgi:hypothetical protein
MAVITRSAHPDLLWPGVMATFGTAYNEFPPIWSQIFEKRMGTKAWETIVETGGFGLAPVKSEGAPIQYDTDAQGPKTTLTQVVYGLGYMVTREELEDNQYLEVSRRRSRNLAKSMRATAETVHANVLNRGFNSSYLGGDGYQLIGTAHPTPFGNQSNYLTTPADLSESSLEDLLTQIAAAKDRRGLPIKLSGVKLVVHPANLFNATRILNSTLRVGTANNDPNAIRTLGMLSGGIITNPYLTDLDAWFLITDAEEGLVSIWRREVEIEKDNDFDTENAKAKATMRFIPGWGDWRQVYGSEGA